MGHGRQDEGEPTRAETVHRVRRCYSQDITYAQKSRQCHCSHDRIQKFIPRVQK